MYVTRIGARWDPPRVAVETASSASSDSPRRVRWFDVGDDCFGVADVFRGHAENDDVVHAIGRCNAAQFSRFVDLVVTRRLTTAAALDPISPARSNAAAIASAAALETVADAPAPAPLASPTASVPFTAADASPILASPIPSHVALSALRSPSTPDASPLSLVSPPPAVPASVESDEAARLPAPVQPATAATTVLAAAAAADAAMNDDSIVEKSFEIFDSSVESIGNISLEEHVLSPGARVGEERGDRSPALAQPAAAASTAAVNDDSIIEESFEAFDSTVESIGDISLEEHMLSPGARVGGNRNVATDFGRTLRAPLSSFGGAATAESSPHGDARDIEIDDSHDETSLDARSPLRPTTATAAVAAMGVAEGSSSSTLPAIGGAMFSRRAGGSSSSGSSASSPSCEHATATTTTTPAMLMEESFNDEDIAESENLDFQSDSNSSFIYGGPSPPKGAKAKTTLSPSSSSPLKTDSPTRSTLHERLHLSHSMISEQDDDSNSTDESYGFSFDDANSSGDERFAVN